MLKSTGEGTYPPQFFRDLAMSYAAEIPTLVEELDRKVTDALTDACTRTESGDITLEDAALIGKALWSATSGLVSNDVSELCAKVSDSAGARRYTAHFVNTAQAVTVYWTKASDDYVVVTLNILSGAKKPHRIHVPAGEQKVQLEKLFSTLVKSNYRKL
jgi:hypothetical protein